MAESTTYTSLFRDIQQYMDRGGVEDTTVYDQIPRFIMRAQQRLIKEAPSLISSSPLTYTLQIGQPIIAKPTGWRQTDSFNIGTGTLFNTRKQVYYRTYEWCRIYWPDPTVVDATQPPLYYSDYDFEHFFICPTPALAYPFEIIVQADAEPLDGSNQVNYFTKKAPDLLLHASLLEAATFLANPAKQAVEQAHYDRLLQGYGVESKDQQTDASEDNGKK